MRIEGEILLIIKETKNNGTLSLKIIDKNFAKSIIIENHYSKTWNDSFGILNLGIYKEGIDDCLGVAVFGNLMNPKACSTIGENIDMENVLELNRLWVDDRLVKNAESTFLGMCFKYIKNNYKEVKYIQSFADGRLGCGTIYKACNFKYYGYFESLFFEDKDSKEVLHKIPFENASWVFPMAVRNLSLVNGQFNFFITKTYKYIYCLDNKDYKNIKLKEKPYCKYDKGFEYVDFVQKKGVLARSYLAFIWADEYELANQILEYMTIHYGKLNEKEIRELAYSKAMSKWFINEEETKAKMKKLLYNFKNRLHEKQPILLKHLKTKNID